jgi:hypothetical protein
MDETKIFFAIIRILGPLWCQGLVVMLSIVKNADITAPYC